MNAPQARDRLFSELHVAVLKPRSFRKAGSWSIKTMCQIHVAINLRSSRWCDQNEANFWLDLKVFHEGWYTLLTGAQPFPSPKENTPSFVYEVLGSLEGPQHRQIVINSTTDLAELLGTLTRRLQEHAFPVEESCSTLQGILDYVRTRGDWPSQAMAAAGASLLLGQDRQAHEFMALAKENAAHENTLAWLELQEQNMWANHPKVVASST